MVQPWVPMTLEINKPPHCPTAALSVHIPLTSFWCAALGSRASHATNISGRAPISSTLFYLCSLWLFFTLLFSLFTLPFSIFFGSSLFFYFSLLFLLFVYVFYSFIFAFLTPLFWLFSILLCLLFWMFCAPLICFFWLFFFALYG